MLQPHPCLAASGLPEDVSAPARHESSRISFWAASSQTLTADARARLRKRLKFFLRAWLSRRLTRVWLARLVQPDLAPLWAARPRLATKLQRPYLCAAWDAPVRLAALLGHYDLLPRLLAPEARLVIYRDSVCLLRLRSPISYRKLDVKLFYRDQFEKEGELTLAIEDVATKLMLAGLSFSLARNDGRRLAIVGGLQASPDPRMRNLIHDVAKEMHGLRPKAFTLWCLQQIAPLWQIAQLQAVSDEQHIYRHPHKHREIAACYDEFWRESGGEPFPGGGGWELPLQPRQRTRAELKPSRRRQHELRYKMLGELQPKLLAALGSLAPKSGMSQTEIYSAAEAPATANEPPLALSAENPAAARTPIVDHSF